MRFTLSSFTAFALFAAEAFAASRTSAPAGAIIVDPSGAKGFKTIQAAVDSLSVSSTADQAVFIMPGTYNEQVVSVVLSRHQRSIANQFAVGPQAQGFLDHLGLDYRRHLVQQEHCDHHSRRGRKPELE